jgi:chromosomal replication initiation ATPase DnaA
MTADEIIEADRARARLVMHLVAGTLSVPVSRMAGPSRGAREATARILSYYVTRTAFGMSLSRVAAAFRRDRSTIAHGCNRMEDKRDDPRFDRWVEALELAAVTAPAPFIAPESEQQQTGAEVVA